MIVKQPILSPIRFHDPGMEFDNEYTFQNPDNRLSTAYDWENVNEVPYALPIPKKWPDYQPGIDILLTLVDASDVSDIYAKLYDADDAEYIDLYVHLWSLGPGSPANIITRIFLDGNAGTGVEDGYYTIKIFQTSDDTLLLESEMLLIGDWFYDCVPFEYWNFENDFGIYFQSNDLFWTGRIMVPLRVYDPSPQFEKEVYKNDPGVMTTLRSVPQRIFNFDSHPLPVHLIELLQMAFACSELYLDRIKINSEESPESELYEGTNLKYLTGKATFVNFNDSYLREIVETSQEDQSIDWASHTYGTATITGNSIAVNTASVAGTDAVESDPITYVTNDIYLVGLVLTDDAGDSDLPNIYFGGTLIEVKEWGVSWFSFRMADDDTDVVTVYHTNGEKAVYTAVITVYKIT